MKIKMFDEEDEKDLENSVNSFLEVTDKEIIKVIVIKGKIVNIVAK